MVYDLVEASEVDLVDTKAIVASHEAEDSIEDGVANDSTDHRELGWHRPEIAFDNGDDVAGNIKHAEESSGEGEATDNCQTS